MKKTIILSLIILTIIFSMSNKNNIPDDAIRLRVIANSNSKYDQDIKMKVSDNVTQNMYYLLNNIDNIGQARTKIKDNLSYIENNIENVLKEENYNLGFEMNYGMNYFPEKEYDGKTYKEGKYESLVVTLGSGEGNNWWCVLFPPLCLIEAEETNKDDVEYKSFFKELIEKIF